MNLEHRFSGRYSVQTDVSIGIGGHHIIFRKLARYRYFTSMTTSKPLGIFSCNNSVTVTANCYYTCTK
jgi:hypothetical protein